MTHWLSPGPDTFLMQRVTILTSSTKMHLLSSEFSHKYTKSFFHWFTHIQKTKKTNTSFSAWQNFPKPLESRERLLSTNAENKCNP